MLRYVTLSSVCHSYQTTSYLLNIGFIFDMCNQISAAATPVKGVCDSKELSIIFRNIIKLPNGASVAHTPALSLRRLLCVVWTPDPTYESLIQSQCLPTFRIIVPVLDSMEADYVSYITDRRARPQYWDMKNPIRTWRYYCVGYYLKHIWKQVNQIIDSKCKNVFLFVHF